MSSFNRVILLGNITRDIEIRYTPGGTAVTEIGLAVNDRRKNQAGEWVDETTFVDITFWGRTAEVLNEYSGKGKQILVEGRLKLDRWEDKQTGNPRQKLRVVGEKMQLLGGRSGDSSNHSAPQSDSYSTSQPSGGGSNIDDDIPF